MTKLLRLFSVVFLFFTSVAFAASTKEVQMVSYFPVPYAAYNNLNVTEELQVGLSSGSNVTAGSGSMSADNSLYAPKATVADHTGTANINISTINTIDSTTNSGSGITLGSGNTDAVATFHDVSVGTVAQSTTANKKVHVEAKDLKTGNSGTFSLFGKGLSTTTNTDSSFCANKNGEQIPATWKWFQVSPNNYKWVLGCGEEVDYSQQCLENGGYWNGAKCTCFDAQRPVVYEFLGTTGLNSSNCSYRTATRVCINETTDGSKTPSWTTTGWTTTTPSVPVLSRVCPVEGGRTYCGTKTRNRTCVNPVTNDRLMASEQPSLPHFTVTEEGSAWDTSSHDSECVLLPNSPTSESKACDAYSIAQGTYLNTASAPSANTRVDTDNKHLLTGNTCSQPSRTISYECSVSDKSVKAYKTIYGAWNNASCCYREDPNDTVDCTHSTNSSVYKDGGKVAVATCRHYHGTDSMQQEPCTVTSVNACYHQFTEQTCSCDNPSNSTIYKSGGNVAKCTETIYGSGTIKSYDATTNYANCYNDDTTANRINEVCSCDNATNNTIYKFGGNVARCDVIRYGDGRLKQIIRTTDISQCYNNDSSQYRINETCACNNSTNSTIYKVGGNVAKCDVIKYGNGTLKEILRTTDVNSCYNDDTANRVNKTCECDNSTNSSVYKTGGNAAKCDIIEYGSGTRKSIVRTTDYTGCWNRFTDQTCACNNSTNSTIYKVGGNVAKCTEDIYGSGTVKQIISTTNYASCYNDDSANRVNKTCECDNSTNSSVYKTGGNAAKCDIIEYGSGTRKSIVRTTDYSSCWNRFTDQTCDCGNSTNSTIYKFGGTVAKCTEDIYGSGSVKEIISTTNYASCYNNDSSTNRINETCACNNSTNSTSYTSGGNVAKCDVIKYGSGTLKSIIRTTNKNDCYYDGTSETCACDNSTNSTSYKSGGSVAKCTIRHYGDGSRNPIQSTTNVNSCYYDGTSETCNCSNHGTYKLGGDVAKCTIRHFGSGSTSVQSVTNANSCYYDGTSETCNCSNHGTYKLGGDVAKCTIRHYANGTSSIQSVTNVSSCYYDGTGETCACDNSTNSTSYKSGGSVAKCTIRHFGSSSTSIQSTTNVSSCYYDGTSETCNCSNHGTYSAGGNSAQCTIRHFGSGSTSVQSVTNANSCYYDGTNETCNCSNHGTYKLGGDVARCTIRHFGSGSTSVQSVTNANSCYYEDTPSGYCGKRKVYGSGSTDTSGLTSTSATTDSTIACSSWSSTYSSGGNIVTKKVNKCNPSSISYTGTGSCYYDGTNETCDCSNHGTYKLGGGVAKCTIRHYASSSNSVQSVTNANSCYYEDTPSGYCGKRKVYGSGSTDTSGLTSTSATTDSTIACSSWSSTYSSGGNIVTKKVNKCNGSISYTGTGSCYYTTSCPNGYCGTYKVYASGSTTQSSDCTSTSATTDSTIACSSWSSTYSSGGNIITKKVNKCSGSTSYTGTGNCYYDGTNETCSCGNHGTYSSGGNSAKCTIRHYASGSTSVQSVTNVSSCYYDGTNETCNCSNHGTYSSGGNVAKCTIRHYGSGTNSVQSVTNANSCYYTTNCPAGYTGTYKVYGSGTTTQSSDCTLSTKTCTGTVECTHSQVGKCGSSTASWSKSGYAGTDTCPTTIPSGATITNSSNCTARSYRWLARVSGVYSKNLSTGAVTRQTCSGTTTFCNGIENVAKSSSVPDSSSGPALCSAIAGTQVAVMGCSFNADINGLASLCNVSNAGKYVGILAVLTPNSSQRVYALNIYACELSC